MLLQFIYQPIPVHHVEVSDIMTRQSMANNLTVLYISEKGTLKDHRNQTWLM